MGMTLSLFLVLQGVVHGILHHIFFNEDEHKLNQTEGRKFMHIITSLAIVFALLLYLTIGFEGIFMHLAYILIFGGTITIGAGAYLEWRYLKQSNVYALTLSTLAFVVTAFYYFH
ncbi:DUF4181 domain-containing protein [Alkalibacillus haloalkaliphilus]|uniref:DUF4181 domain-containing protein n=1 Tax=Alkalibacillus haloalkaliphilus TaxID=94136 RepID=A0A511W686_9BACI|nr:DUF4181 domain-containing protein [Alkalibacillus haloalkaliphilus]GEN45573.1 hypothetical protein AHA02nite_13490 [Alkalibacillus haloalkaliphilus]